MSKLGSLSEELQIVTEKFKSVAPEEIQEYLWDYLQRWKTTEILQDALKEGDVAPDFVLPDQDGNMVSSVDLRAKGPIVVIFFRGNWCVYCDATLRMIRKYTPHFKARGASVVAISPQTVEHCKAIQKKAGLTFPVLSDVSSEYSQLLHIAFVLDEKLQKFVETSQGKSFAEINGTNKNDDDGSAVLPIPATYVIQSDGRVSYSFLDTDFTKRAEPLDVLNALPPLPKRRLCLQELIDVEMGQLRDTHSENRMRLLFDAVEEAKAQGMERRALQVGDKAPEFRLRTKDGDRIDSNRVRQQGPLIVTFHHHSSVCRIQLDALQRLLPKFQAKGASLIAISPNKSTESGIQFPLLQDTPEQSIAKQFGLLYRLPQLVGDAKDVPMAATYVIDRTGAILYSFVDADPTRRAEPLKILKAIPSASQLRPKRGPFSLLFGKRMAPRIKKACNDV